MKRLALATSCFVLASPVLAQNDDGAPKPRKNRLLEEVVVTAQKREEASTDIPIAIQAFGSGSLDAQNISSTEDLGPLVPSLRFTESAGFTLIYLRGVGTSQFVPSADPSIATYTDGIYMPTGQAGTKALGNVERVEVLKGPQGTLFGRNTIGGAINVITKKPGPEVEALVRLEKSDLDQKGVSAAISGPITDWLFAGIALGVDKEESYVKLTQHETPEGETKLGRIQFVLDMTENISADFTAYHQKQENVSLSIGQNSKPKPLGTSLGIEPQGDDYSVDNDLKPESRSDQTLIYGTLTWALPWFDFKVLASDQEVNITKYTYDFDGSEQPYVAFDTDGDFSDLPGEYTTLESLEVQFLSNEDSWNSANFEWVAGLYAFHSIGAFDPARFQAAPGVVTALEGAAGGFPEGLGSVVDQLAISGTSLSDDGLILLLSGVLETDSYSAYAQGTYTITHWLDITLGGRYQTEERYLTKSETNALAPDGSRNNVFKFPLQGQKEENFSPKAQLSFRPFDDHLYYVSYGEGYKSGTYNIVAIYTAPDYVVPEKVTSYEIGAKTEFLDGNLKINGAIYYNLIEDLQDGFVSLASGGAVSFNTAPEAETKGAEFDFQFVPFPMANPGLVVTGNFGYVEAIYTDFPNGEGFDEESGQYSDSIDLTGYSLRNTPKRTGGLGFVQAIDFRDGTLELGADAYHSSRFYYNANNTVSEDPYTTVNARISYEHLPWNMRLTVYGRNLTDTRYHVQQFETDFGLLTTLAPPKSIGAKLSWEY